MENNNSLEEVKSVPVVPTMPPETPIVTQTVVEAPPQSQFPDSTKKPRKFKGVLLVPIIMAVLIIVLAGVWVLKKDSFNKPSPSVSPVPSVVANTVSVKANYDQWVNCSDVRDIIEDGDTWYVGCYGGVIVYSPKTGEVVKQFTETNGLPSAVVTQMALKKPYLYVGTQDGIGIINLSSGEIKKVSVKEGLPSGANIGLTLDGETLWVSTFNGAAKLNLANNSVSGIETLANKNIRQIVVTQNYVYAVPPQTGSNTPAIFVMNKKTGTWSNYPKNIFSNEVTGFSEALVSGENIYLSDRQNAWKGKEGDDIKWEKVTALSKEKESELKTLLGANADKIYFNKLGDLYSFDETAGSVTQEKYDTKIMTFAPFSHIGNVIYFNNYQWGENPNSVWVSRFDLSKLESQDFKLKSRPIRFQKLYGTINGNPVLLSDMAIQEYDKTAKTFTRLFSLKGSADGDISIIRFIPGTQTMLVYSQFCTQGCTEPMLFEFNYQDKKETAINFPAELMMSLGSKDKNFSPLTLVKESIDAKRFVFSSYDKKTLYEYSLTDKSWKKLDKLPEEGKSYSETTSCNPTFAFTSGVFAGDMNCYEREKIIENGNEWSTSGEDLIRKSSSGEEKITLPYAPAYYTPFEETAPAAPRLLFLYKNLLFVSSGRGMFAVDVRTKIIKRFDTTTGLVNNGLFSDASNMGSVYDGTNLWSVNSYGFSRTLNQN